MPQILSASQFYRTFDASFVQFMHSFINLICVPTEDIKVFSWGRADYGQLGLGDDVVQLGFSSEPAEVVHVRGANQV